MKFTIQFKDPDGVYEGLKQAAEDSLKGVGHDLDEDELADVLEGRLGKFGEEISKWVDHGEYITIEFDMEKGTAEVVKK